MVVCTVEGIENVRLGGKQQQDCARRQLGCIVIGQYTCTDVTAGCMDTVWYEVYEEKKKRTQKTEQNPQRAEFNLAK